MAKRNKDVSEENVPRATREEQSNGFSSLISIKFAVPIIMLVDIHIALLLVEFIFRGGEMKCVSLAPYVTDYSVCVYSR